MHDGNYSEVCGACSVPLVSPPRDGAGSMCAYLHTEQGQKDFEGIIKGKARDKRVKDTFTNSDAGNTNIGV